MNNFVKKLICLFLVLFTISNLSFSQGITVSGSVSDENGSLIGVNILVKGKVLGTISDRDGNYTLDVNESPLTLIFFTTSPSSRQRHGSDNIPGNGARLPSSPFNNSEYVFQILYIEPSNNRSLLS